MEEKRKTGVVEEGLGGRVLQELLRTGPFKEALTMQLKDIDSEKAAALARTLMWEDVGVFLSLIGALPDIMNWSLEFVLELGRQFNNMPPHLLKEFIKQLVAGMDGQRLSETGAVYGLLLKRLLLEDEEALEGFIRAGVTACNSLLAGLDEITSGLAQDPERTAGMVVRCLRELDRGALGRTASNGLRLLVGVVRSSGILYYAVGAGAGILGYGYVRRRSRRRRFR